MSAVLKYRRFARVVEILKCSLRCKKVTKSNLEICHFVAIAAVDSYN